MNKTVVVNFLAGPSSGKSSMAMSLCAKLKWMGVNCEFTGEFAKDKTWENSLDVLDNQIMVFGEQHHRLWRLSKKVDIIVCDSPLLLTAIYDKNKSSELKGLVMEEYDKYHNINFFVVRKKKYNPFGRAQTEEESLHKDREILEMLNADKIPYQTVDGVEEKVAEVTYKVLSYERSILRNNC
jgi:nicotinamide riboside kinase